MYISLLFVKSNHFILYIYQISKGVNITGKVIAESLIEVLFLNKFWALNAVKDVIRYLWYEICYFYHNLIV